MTVASEGRAASRTPPEAVGIKVSPLFEAVWSYKEFVSLMPFGPRSDGQAYGYSNAGSRVTGERLSGEYTLVQYPRRRSDDILIPDSHGMVQASKDQIVMTRAGGFGIPTAPGHRAITHWMHFVAAGEFAWLNGVVAAGVGEIVDEVAKVRYVQVFPAAPGEAIDEDSAKAAGMKFTLLGTATWEYRFFERTRPFGDGDGQSFAHSIGHVEGGDLAGAWRGWHYPSRRRDGLYLLDAHVEIATKGGPVLSRHAGLSTRSMAGSTTEPAFDEVHHATFTTEVRALNYLNSTLAIGVGRVIDPGIVTVSYYGLGAVSTEARALPRA